MTDTLTFEKESHAYKLGDRAIPSVTQALDGAGLVDKQWYTEEARERGTNVALATQYYDDGELDLAQLPEGLEPYIKGWAAFIADSGFTILANEERVHDPLFGFAGTVDRRGILNNFESIIDIKTGGKSIWHPIQLAGYAMCYQRPLRRVNVYLNPDGKYSVKTHTDPADRGVWLAALTLANFKRGKHGWTQ